MMLLFLDLLSFNVGKLMGTEGVIFNVLLVFGVSLLFLAPQ